MPQHSFTRHATVAGSDKWPQATQRRAPLYARENDIRSEFARDYNRILHCTAYRRLKHKTQVFFATSNDHICTRIEHVGHVDSVSETIAHFLGLNTELTSAIAVGHDLGHAPFGHAGEDVLKDITADRLHRPFWHERNSLRFVDRIETLEDCEGRQRNLDLTYAVRDGIVCHCGEVDENGLRPREQALDLADITAPGQVPPFTWEGCVVKVSDKIAYLGRDIEDALRLGILTKHQIRELVEICSGLGTFKVREINNTVLMHDLIVDICANSRPEEGVRLSPPHLEVMNRVKAFNYDNIYDHPRLTEYKKYVRLVLRSIFDRLMTYREDPFELLDAARHAFPVLADSFRSWLVKYAVQSPERAKPATKHKNEAIYDLGEEDDYIQAVVDYLSGMTDQFAIKIFNEIISF